MYALRVNKTVIPAILPEYGSRDDVDGYGIRQSYPDA